MKLLSFKKDGNKAVAHLILDIEEFEKAVDTVWKRQRRWFDIPGFRKGKVPRGIVENEYGKDIFYESALELLYPKMLEYLMEESQEKIISIEGELYMQMDKESKPEIVNKDEENVEVKMNMNIYPEIDIDYNNLEVEIAPERQATDKEVEDYKENARREMKNKYMDLNHRVVDGDFVRLNINWMREIDPAAGNVALPEGFDAAGGALEKDGLDAQGNVVRINKFLQKIKNLEGFKLKIGSGNFAPLEEAIKGHSISEKTFESDLVFPESWPSKDIAGKRVRASLQLMTVKRPYTMLEVAQKQGFATEEEFTNSVRNDINNYYNQNREENKRKELRDKLSSLVPDDFVAGDLLEGRVKLAKEQFAQQVRQRFNQNLEDWAEESYPGKLKGLEAEISNSVKSEFKKAIALSNIARKENITATNDEMQAFRSTLSKQGFPVNELSDANVKEVVALNKALEFLVSKVKFVDKKEESKADAETQKEVEKSDVAHEDVETKEPDDIGANDSKKVTQLDAAHEDAEK